MALAEALGIDSNPRYGGEDGRVAYLIYPGSGNGRPRTLEGIRSNSNQLFSGLGWTSEAERMPDGPVAEARTPTAI